MSRPSAPSAIVPGIDLVKPVLALLVIWIHTAPLARPASTVNTYVTAGAARLAVPLYLAISGYLLFRRMNPPVRRQIRRLLELYLIWVVLYLPVIVHDQLSEGLEGPVHLVRLVLTGGMTHLWYLPTAAIGIGIVAIGLRVMSPGRLLVVLACLSAVGTLAYGAQGRGMLSGGGVQGLVGGLLTGLDDLSLAPRDGVFTGACYVAAGAWVARTGGWRPRTAVAVTAVAWIGMLGEVFVRRRAAFGADLAEPVATCSLCAVVLVPALLRLLVARTARAPLPGQVTARRTGSLVYFVHYGVLTAFGADIAHSAGPIRSLLIALVSFALSVCLVGASRVRGLGLLKRLY